MPGTLLASLVRHFVITPNTPNSISALHHPNNIYALHVQPPKSRPSLHFIVPRPASSRFQTSRVSNLQIIYPILEEFQSAAIFSESLLEMGSCLLEKTVMHDNGESKGALSMLGKLRLELQKLVNTYVSFHCHRSHIIMTITNPLEALLSELLKVELVTTWMPKLWLMYSEGSPGPVRAMLKLGSTVEEMIKLVVKKAGVLILIKALSCILHILALKGNATHDFEDTGHSDNAREIMEKYYNGEIDPS
ncbi:hypothetical protein OROMI_014724 [Orobanche minor]